MSELSVGSLSGLAANSYVVDVAAGSTLDLSNATDLPASALPSGSVLQVVQSVKTDAVSSTSTSLADIPGLSVSITPSSASSKVMVIANVVHSHSQSNTYHLFQLVRDATNIAQSTGSPNQDSTFSPVTWITTVHTESSPIFFLDSPATTSATTYKLQWQTGAGTVYLNRRAVADDWRSISTITLMEIAG